MENVKMIKKSHALDRKEPVVYLFYVVAILVTIICFVPFWLIVVGSLSDETIILEKGYSLWPEQFSLESYKMVFEMPVKIIQAYQISILITVVGTFVALMLSSMAAYVLMRKDFKYRNVIAMLLYFPSIFGAGMLPNYLLVVQYLGLKNNILALILPGMISAWNIFLLRNFMSDIPVALIEAAKLDGANDFKIYLKLIMPLSKAGLATIGLFTALGYWNNWSNAMLYISKSELYPLQYLLYSMLSNAQGLKEIAAASGIVMPRLPSETYKMAMSVVTTGPILLLYPYVQRYFIKGITVGSVKG